MKTAEQKREYDRLYYRRNREKIIARSAAHHKNNRSKKNEAQRKYYRQTGKWKRIPGWTKELYDQKFKECSGRCTICYSDTLLVRDHDHKTGKARDLICDPCNKMLGASRDDTRILSAGIEYLKRFLICFVILIGILKAKV